LKLSQTLVFIAGKVNAGRERNKINAEKREFDREGAEGE
jgi:hypothetical protein